MWIFDGRKDKLKSLNPNGSEREGLGVKCQPFFIFHTDFMCKIH
jgi:hypothetical protein